MVGKNRHTRGRQVIQHGMLPSRGMEYEAGKTSQVYFSSNVLF